MIELLHEALSKAKPYLEKGKPAEYIPALLSANSNHLGIAVATIDGKYFSAGDIDVLFSIQSVSKVFSLSYVLQKFGTEKVREKVGVEPSGNPFYSLVQLEYEAGKPRNPFVNAGAIAITSMIPGEMADEKFLNLKNFITGISGNPVQMIVDVYRSEFDTSHRNRALGHFMKHFGVIDGSVMESVDTYFRQCAIGMTCEQLAQFGVYLANQGVNPKSGNTVLSKEQTTFVNALMSTCGLYDASGEFGIRVGIPAKSGVGGGILAIVPGKMAIATFGPSLDEKGNSIGGIIALEYLSQKLSLSLF